MAEFNPQVPEQNMPDWSRTSRGTSGDTSMGTLFKGIGDTLGAAVQTGDNFVKNTIEDASRYSKESIDNEMGFNSQQYNPDIAASEQVLSRLQAAKAQGKVSEEYYYQRLSNTMKGLRARFPGYEKEVDQIFSRVTGQNPANAFRDSLLQSINTSLAANKASADKDADYIRQNGYKIPQTVRDDPNISNAQKVSMIQNQESKNYQIDSATKQMEFDTKNQKQLYSNVASQVSADAINKVNQSLGLNNGGFTELLQRFGNGQGISQENKASLNAALQTVISGVETDLINRGAKATTLSMTEAADIRSKALEPLKQLQTLINSDQYSQAAQLAASLNFQNDQATAAMTKQFPFLQNLSVVNKLGGGQAAGSLMSDWMLKGDNATQLQTFSMKTLAGNVAGAIVTGQMSWGEAGKAIANNQDMSDPKQRAGLMLSVLSGFKYFAANGKQSPSEVAGFVQKAYGENPQNNDFWRAVSDPDKRNLYSTMFAPEITQKVIDSKDPQAIETYKQSALNYAQSLPDLRKDAGTTASATIAKRYVDITFNEKTNRLEATLNAAGQKLSQNQNDISQSELRDAQETIGKSVNSLNRVVSVLAPIYKAEGQDPRQMTQKLIESLGGSADPNTPEQNQGMIPWLLSKVGLADKADVTVGGNSGLAATPEAKGPELSSQAAEISGDLKPEDITPNIPSAEALQKFRTTGPINDTKGGDAMLSLIGRAEGTDKTGNGYNTSLANGALLPGGKEMNLTGMTIGQIRQLQQEMLRNPNNRWNSSALGRYQIVGKTLQGLIDRGVVSLDDKFDEATQDKLAKVLIEDSGYSAWKAGKMSDAEFSRNLSGQWASLANTSGKTYYANQPRVGATSQEVLSAAAGSPSVGVSAPAPKGSTPSQSSGTPLETPAGASQSTPSQTQQPQEALMTGMPKENDFGNTFRRAGQILDQNPGYRGPGGIYGAIPEKDDRGENQIQKFLAWNPDPVGNEAANLNGLNSALAKVYEKAKKDNPDLPFVLGVGRRYDDAQRAAKSWGWSKTLESDHKYGEAMDVWPLNEQGQVVFDKSRQEAVAYAIKKAAAELGVNIEAGADFKKFKDLPHFAVKH